MLTPSGSSPKNFIRITRPDAPSELSVNDSASEPNAGPTDSIDIGSSKSVDPSQAVARNTRPSVVEGEVMVKTKPSLFKSEQDSLLESLGASVKERFEFPKELFKSFEGEVLRLQLPDGLSTREALAQLADDPRVAYAVPNEIIYLDEVATDESSPSFAQPSADSEFEEVDSKLWGLHNWGQDKGTVDADIDAPEAWQKTIGSNDVVVAVIDTGVDYTHPDLIDNMWVNTGEIPGDGLDNDNNGVIDDIHGYNAIADSGDPMDGHSHGTHAAGTVAATGLTDEGVVGVAPQAKIQAIKIFDDKGKTTSDSILRGVLYAAENGARITSNSWGGGEASELVKEAFEKSAAFHVMAAGNDGRDVDGRQNFPSGYDIPNSISVAATDRNDELADFSNFGRVTVDIAAPGVETYSTIPNGLYGNKNGTSMATPHVSGAAVLMVAHNPNITNEELKSQLMRGAEPLPALRGKTVSGARLNVNNSLERDDVAPGEIRDFKSKANDAASIGVSFTATGDDGFQGQASTYDVRVSDQPIQTLEQFLQAAPYDVGKPSAAGAEEKLDLAVAPSSKERQMHVAVRAFDNLSNASPFVAQTVNVPSADLAYTEPVEVDTQGWTTEGSWGIETTPRGVVFSDSPGELSPSQADNSITSPVIDLSEFKGSALVFDADYKLEEVYDQIHLEAARPVADGEKQDWVELKSYTGAAMTKDEVVDLSAFDGGNVQFRFRLTTDQSYTEDGFKFDNVRILGKKLASVSQ